MSRKNPEVERLELLVTSLRRTLADRQRDPGDMPVRGCGDTSCLVARPQGMATNGGCRCELSPVRRALGWWKRRAAFLEETIRDLKATPAPSATAEDERTAAVAYLRQEADTNWDDETPPHRALVDAADWIEQGGHRRQS